MYCLAKRRNCLVARDWSAFRHEVAEAARTRHNYLSAALAAEMMIEYKSWSVSLRNIEAWAREQSIAVARDSLVGEKWLQKDEQLCHWNKCWHFTPHLFNKLPYWVTMECVP